MTRTALLEVGKQQADSWLIDNWQRIKAKQNITIKKDSANSNSKVNDKKSTSRRYYMFDYDKAMADEENHIFTNIHNGNTEDLPEDPSASYNLDDWETIVHEEDYIFVALFLKSDGNTRKFVLQQDNFLEALDNYGPQNLVIQELEIINGNEWLDYQRRKY